MTDSFLKSGWKFPVKVDSSTGRIQTVSGEEDIKESIRIILLTGYKERIMKSEFGSSMREYMFSPSSQSTYSSMEVGAKTSIETWEPRVKNVDVKVYSDEKNANIIYVEVRYTIRNTEDRINQIVSFDIDK